MKEIAAWIDLYLENLFDSRQKDFQDNGEERDPTYFYGPTRPRSFYLSLSLEW